MSNDVQSLKLFISNNSNCLVLILISIFFKLLLIPVYHSTDFEVHRNWLAITHTLPIKDWYFENTSEWTLDYPPFFAYFEYLLSLPAYLVDKQMLDINNLNYKSHATVNYQRCTVILTELVLVYALLKYLKSLDQQSGSNKLLGRNCFITVQIALNFALIMIDNIHFQYNGFLFGIMLLSIFNIQSKNWLLGSFLFSTLINFKHIYLYIAPAYFFHILFFHCLQSPTNIGKLIRLVKVGISAIIPFIISLGPFIYMNQLPQLFSRLFPFKRGLCHAYWAPNAWAIYNFIDKLLAVALQKKQQSVGSTSGLVQDIEHIVLPSIPPSVTFLLSLVFMVVPTLVFIYRRYARPNSNCLVTLTVICGFASFLFGWHVHEKAVLMILIPLSCISLNDRNYAELYFVMSLIGNYSLFPLVFRNEEYALKLLCFILFTYYNYLSLKTQFKNLFGLDLASKSAIIGIVIIETYNVSLHYMFSIDKKLPYLPLMLTSVFCSLFVIYSWIRFMYLVFTSKKNQEIKTE